MSKATFRNDSVATIYLEEYGHQQILVSEVVNILDDNQETKFADSTQLNTLITAGDLVYIDDLGADRTATDAAQILEGMRDKVVAGGTIGQLLCTNAAGDLVWTTPTNNSVAFFDDGAGSANLWMKQFEGQMGTSDKEPAIMLFDCVVYGLTFVNKDDSRGGDIEIYKNASLLYTWNIVDKRWAYKTDGLSAVTFSAGDRMSVYLGSIGDDPNDPFVTVHYAYTSGATGSGGAETGV